jgi:formylglycine-generating enzyme required for sulfatase activity
MTKHLIARLVVILCVAFCFINAAGLFAQTQRGMKISVRTKAGQDLPLYNKSYALVVGNGNYTNGWDPLKGAFKDVKEVATALEKHGFNVTLKTDLTKADFDTTFEAFIRNGRDEDSRLLFYYAGHGHTETLRTGDKLGYLVMVDSPMPTTSGKIDGSKNVDMESLVTQAKRIDALHVLYVFDSCFSGSILNARSIPQPPAIQDSVKYPVRQFITAGRADEPVPDYSVFKRAFLDLLEGKVDEPIPDGYITGEELGLYLKNAVSTYNPAQTPQYGKINDPNLNKGDFVFVVQQGKIQLTGTFAVTSTWSLGAKSLAPSERSAVLSLQSDPSDATVYINDVRVGRTPLTEYQIGTRGYAEEAVTVRLERGGYNSEELTLKPGKETGWLDASLPDARQEIVGKDGAKMVLISAGEFQMGSNNGESDEKPVHTVYVDAFYMDIYEVTNAQYKQFVDANPEWGKDRISRSYHRGDYLKLWNGNSYPPGKGSHPVTFVNWYGAMAYAQWAGKRLPTEAEWEKAARGGLVEKKYPWGNLIDSSKANYGKNVGDTTPVGSYAPNRYGLYDMAGNVWEWCLDAYDVAFYAKSPRKNPIAKAGSVLQVTNNFTNVKNSRVLRGSSWFNNSVSIRVVNRSWFKPSRTTSHLGFRCVRSQ